jgi:hypothetical protein
VTHRVTAARKEALVAPRELCFAYIMQVPRPRSDAVPSYLQARPTALLIVAIDDQEKDPRQLDSVLTVAQAWTLVIAERAKMREAIGESFTSAVHKVHLVPQPFN